LYEPCHTVYVTLYNLIDDHCPCVTDGTAADTSNDVTSGTTATEQPNIETEAGNMEQSPVHHNNNDEVMDTSEQAEDQRQEDEVPAEELQPVLLPPPPPRHRLRHRRFRQPIE